MAESQRHQTLRLVGGTDYIAPATPPEPPGAAAARRLIYAYEVMPGITVYQALRWVCDEAGDAGCDLGDLGPYFDAFRAIGIIPNWENSEEVGMYGAITNPKRLLRAIPALAPFAATVRGDLALTRT